MPLPGVRTQAPCQCGSWAAGCCSLHARAAAQPGGTQPCSITHRLALASAWRSACWQASAVSPPTNCAKLATPEACDCLSKCASNPARKLSPAPTVSTTCSGWASLAKHRAPLRCSSHAPSAPSVSASRCACGLAASRCCARAKASAPSTARCSRSSSLALMMWAWASAERTVVR